MRKITFWMLALFGCLQMQAQLFTVETCSGASSTTTYGPMYSGPSANATNRTAVLYPASQLTLLTGQTLNAAYFNRSTTSGGMAGSPNFKIYLKEVAYADFGIDALDWNTAITGAVLVYDSNPASSVGTNAGWKSFPFTTNFLYSGAQNLAVFYEYTNPTPSISISWYYEIGSPCISTANSNTTKYENNTSGVLPTTLTAKNYRRPLIAFDFVVTCPAPTNFSVTNVTSNSATFNWNQGGAETQWEYAVVPAGSGIPTTTTTVSTTGLVDLPLNPATTYEMYLRSVCSTNDKGYWIISAPFTTQCSGVSSLLENFDSYPTGTTSMPNCWSKIGTGSAYVTTGGNLPGTAPNRFTMSTSTTTFIHAILPTFSNLSDNTHRLKFKTYASSANKTLEVGYQTDLLDPSTFVTLESIDLPSTIAANAEEFIVVPTGVPANVKNLVLKSDNSATTVLYIDDVIWEPAPTCLDVTSIAYSGLTDTSVSINWIATGTESAWQYAYGASELLNPSTLTPVDVTATTAIIPNLTPFTSYKVWVRSNCTAGELGAWIGPITFKTQCSPITSFYENFDSSPTGAAAEFVSCWQEAGNGLVYVTTGGVAPGTAPNRLYMSANGTLATPTEAIAIMPKVTNLQAETHRLKFKAYASAANRSIEVGYLEELTNLSSFNLIQEYNLPSTAASTAEEFTVLPTNIPAGVTNLVFRNSAYIGSTTLYIDDVIWEPIPACADITVINLTDFNSTSVTLAWELGSSETAWQYVYAETTVTDPTTLTSGMVTVNDNPTTVINGLQPSTTYNVWIRSKCGTNAYGSWPQNPQVVTTTCAPVTSFTENFDSYTTGSTSLIPTCWTRFGNTGTSYVNNGSTTPNSAPNRLYLFASATTPTTAIAVLPPVSNLQAETHRLKFKAYATTTNKELEIGYYENAGVATTFTLLESFSLPSTAQTTAEEFIYTPQYVPAGIESLVFRNNAASFTGTTAIYIDDVVWEPIPACFDITEVVSNVLSSSAADITWFSGGSETAWQYVYAVSTVTDPTTLTPTDVSNFAFASLTNLNANTNYNVWIRSNCGSGAIGNWSVPFTFKTDCENTTAFSENFDSYTTGNANPLPNCWQKGGTTSLVYITSGGVAPGSAPNRLYMTANGATPTQSLAIMPPVSNLQAGTHRLKFKSYATVLNRSVEIGYITNSDGTDSFELLTTFNLPGTVANTATSFSYVPTNIPSGANRLAFRNVGIPGGTTTLYIDDVVWEPAPTCPDMNTISFDGANATSANISWPLGGFESAWQYVYALATVTDPTGLTPFEVSNMPSATITNLLPSTTYKVWVRAKCGTEFGVFSAPTTFTTTCETTLTLPWTEGFEATTGSAFPPCWSEENGDYVTAVANNYVLPRTGTRYLRESYSAVNEYMWTPGFELTAGVSYDFSFYMAGDGYDGWAVGVYYNTLQKSNGATQLGTTTNASGVGSSYVIQPYALVKNTVIPTTTGTYYFAVKVNQPALSWYIGFDDFKLEITPTCPVSNAPTASNISLTTATMNWVATTPAPANGYEYYYTTDLATVPTATTTPSGSVGAGVTTASLTDLTTANTYKIYVRSICSANEKSSWSEAGSLNTLCPSSTLPYSIDFESTGSSNLPICTSIENLSAGNNWELESNPGYGFNTTVLSYSYNSSVANAWFYTNTLSLVAGTTYSVSYNYGNNISTTWSEKLRVSYGTSANAAAMTTQIADHPMIQQATIQSNVATFTPETSGDYVIGFNAYSAASQYYLYLDNILIQEVLSSEDFDTNSFTAYPNPVKNVLNIRFTQNISDVAVYNLLGQQVLFMKMNADQGQVDLSNLASGTYLVKATTENGTKTIKVIKE